MSDIRDDMPKTPGAMLDQLHEWFGIGDYDDIASTKPFHRARMVEIAKLKALLKSRRASLAEVWIAANYAREYGKTPRATWQVFALIPEAMRERFRKAAVSGGSTEWVDAIEEALEAEERDWAERIMRAADKAKVVEEWRNRG